MHACMHVCSMHGPSVHTSHAGILAGARSPSSKLASCVYQIVAKPIRMRSLDVTCAPCHHTVGSMPHAQRLALGLAEHAQVNSVQGAARQHGPLHLRQHPVKKRVVPASVMRKRCKQALNDTDAGLHQARYKPHAVIPKQRCLQARRGWRGLAITNAGSRSPVRHSRRVADIMPLVISDGFCACKGAGAGHALHGECVA